MTGKYTLRSAGFFKASYIYDAYEEAKQIAYNQGFENPDYVFDFRDNFKNIQALLGNDFIRIIRSGICGTERRTHILASDLWEMYRLGQERSKKGLV